MITMSRTTQTFTIWQGEDQARYRELAAAESAAERAAADKTGRARLMGELTPVEAARRAVEEFVAEAEPRAVKVEFVDLPSERWFELVRKNTSDDGTLDDIAFGKEMLTESIVSLSQGAHTESPSASEAAAFVASLSSGDFDALHNVVFRHNRQRVDPKAVRPSTSQASAAT